MKVESRGYTILEAIISLVAFALIIGGGYLLYHHGHKTSSSSPPAINSQTASTSSASSPYAKLSPATVNSKTAECNQQISYDSDGVPGPVQCSNGDLNVADWQALAALEPKVLSLGYSATEPQVQSTLCSDVQENISNPIEITVYQIAALYYGWNFGSNPTSILSSSSCQNTDD